MKINTIATACLLVLCLASCTLTKKYHSFGWHVEWNNAKPSNKDAQIAQHVANDCTVPVQEKIYGPNLTITPFANHTPAMVNGLQAMGLKQVKHLSNLHVIAKKCNKSWVTNKITYVKEHKNITAIQTNTIGKFAAFLLFILALFIPPLAHYLAAKLRYSFQITLISFLAALLLALLIAVSQGLIVVVYIGLFLVAEIIAIKLAFAAIAKSLHD